MKPENHTPVNINKIAYKIKLDNAFLYEIGRFYALDFKIIKPDNSSYIFRTKYQRNAINRYGKNALIWCSWLKIKEAIEQNSLTGKDNFTSQEPPFIYSNRISSLSVGIDNDVCSQIEANRYLFHPAKIIGFHP